MNAGAPILRHPVAPRVLVLLLSFVVLAGSFAAAVRLDGPLQVLLGVLGFAGYVALFARALDGLPGFPFRP
jgi:hypothetical protein